MNSFGSFERVYVETEWYDGPRSGVADIHGLPHRFKSLFNEKDDEFMGSFLVWPIDETSLNLEIEQWNIFVDWNNRYESGSADIDSHPGLGLISARWDELQKLLEPGRNSVPVTARAALGEMERKSQDKRYDSTGPDYKMRWCFV